MKFQELPVRGALLIDIEPYSDNRGSFARSFCRNELQAVGVNVNIAQANLSINHKKGALRGMHYQLRPAAETKLIRCTRGGIFYAVIDMRPESQTYLQYATLELHADTRRQLYVPEMCAIGYQSLTDDTEVSYLVSEFYAPEYERGVRYDDPQFSITWPLPVTEISEKDANWPLLELSLLAAATE